MLMQAWSQGFFNDVFLIVFDVILVALLKYFIGSPALRRFTKRRRSCGYSIPDTYFMISTPDFTINI